MNSTPHLLVCISGHGYGHVAQVAPVLNALAQLLPGLRLTLRTTISEAHLRSRVATEFRYISEATDFGMVMISALEVQVEESMRAYAEFHADWPSRVKAEAGAIKELAPDLVLSDVAYLPLAGACLAGIPSIAMCSLNWADIFRYFCGAMPGAVEILQQIEQAYLQSETFLRLLPAMPMPWLANQQAIGPVARLSINRRHEINQKLGLSGKDKLVLVSMGGIATHLPVANWPRMPNLHWLVPADWLVGCEREDMLAFESIGMSFSDVLASCDILLTKPGYGAFTEAACNGIPVMYVRRNTWPEQDDLIAWLEQNGLCRNLEAGQMESGNFLEDLQHLLMQRKPKAVATSGAQEAASYLAARLTDSPVQSASRRRS